MLKQTPSEENVTVPSQRLSQANQRPPDPDGAYVLYWMTAARRLSHNFGLQRAAEKARELQKPLVILEALRAGYPHASRRLHRFILDGMAEKAARLAKGPVLYYPFVETRAGGGRGLLPALAGRACLVVADEFPAFFLPKMLAAAAGKVGVRLELVDSCGLLPLAAAGREFGAAHAFRRFLQKQLPGHLADFPADDPLAEPLPGPAAIAPEILRRWPPASPSLLAGEPRALAALPIDQTVGELASRGGEKPAGRRLADFIANRLGNYLSRNHPDARAESGLSPWLHFGHISAHRVFLAVARAEGWAPHRLGANTAGKREGFWGMSPPAEAFLDQLVTWRELGYGFCHFRPDHAEYRSLPDWARQTLAEHRADPRPYALGLARLENAATPDELWNCCQRQLAREGVIHNYLRMLWGKKILEWSESPQVALETMLHLNDKYALDGRDPNSISGIFWCLGRFDRAWGPQRPVFGKVRYMTSASARRKLKLSHYLEKFRE